MGWVGGLSPGNLFPRCSSCLPGAPALQFWAGASCLGAPFCESPRCWFSRWFCVDDGSSRLNSHLILNFLAYCVALAAMPSFFGLLSSAHILAIMFKIDAFSDFLLFLPSILNNVSGSLLPLGGFDFA